MSLKTQYISMSEHNKWANEKIYTVCSKIPEYDRKNDMGAFFRSIHGTLNHLLCWDKDWIERLALNQYTPTTIGYNLYDDFRKLNEEREKIDAWIISWSNDLDEEWLEQPFTYTSDVYGETRTIPTWCLVSNMFNYQIHHRGQITTLIKQLGYEFEIIDLSWMP